LDLLFFPRALISSFRRLFNYGVVVVVVVVVVHSIENDEFLV